MLWTGLIRSDIRQVYFGLLARRELYLGLLSGLLEPLQGQGIVVQVDALVFLELVGKIVDQTHVKILSAEKCIPVGRQHFELMFTVDFGDLD